MDPWETAPDVVASNDPWAAEDVVEATWDFDGEMECDLSFRKGDKITVLTRTDKDDDWWEGELNNKIGIFPANFTKAVK